MTGARVTRRADSDPATSHYVARIGVGITRAGP